MSVTTRTQRATNPTVAVDLTNYTRISGTGGNGTTTRMTSAGADGLAHFMRVQWSVATTAVSGGGRYTQTGLSANTAYTHSIYVRCSKAQTVRIQAVYQTSAAAAVNTVNASAVTLVANTWTRVSVTGTSGASVDRVQLNVEATTGGSTWAVNDTFDMDCVLIETGSTLQPYFDGAYFNGLGHMYAWSGTAHASTSTDTLYDPVLTLTAATNAPTARVEVTIADLSPTPNIVTLWRTADGIRRRVRSYEKVEVIGSDFTTDYEAPLNRTITYEIEVTSGVGAGGPDGSGVVTVAPEDGCGYIQDPLNPESSIKVFALAGPAGEPTLLPDAISKLTYHLDGELVPILGSSEPVALLGQRMARSNIPFDMFTDAAQQSTDMRNLLLNTSLLLVRPGADWGNSLPGLCYVAPPDPQELPIGVTVGAAYTEWKWTASLVAAPAMNLVVPFWSYQDWNDLWATYQSAQTTLAGKTYLAVRRSPANGV